MANVARMNRQSVRLHTSRLVEVTDVVVLELLAEAGPGGERKDETGPKLGT